jgi:anti-sigma B factor antagonist
MGEIQMKIQIEKKEQVKIIRLREERIDTNIAPELKTLFLVWTKPDNARILVDLEKVSYIDSSGLGALLFGYRRARDSNGTVKLMKAQSRVKELLRISHLEDVLTNFENEGEALQSFG